MHSIGPSANSHGSYSFAMTRKPTKGYFVRGQFIAEGSDLDLEMRRETGADKPSKTDLKRSSTELQQLGEQLLELGPPARQQLPLGDKLQEALEAARRISNFEGRRRQMQFVGKLMRSLDEGALAEARAAVSQRHAGSAQQTALLHEAQHWRDQLIADDAALARWMAGAAAPSASADQQQLRALIRQARKDAATQAKALPGAAQRHGRAYREIYQMVLARLAPSQASAATNH
jgi:ribosome-associated protein